MITSFGDRAIAALFHGERVPKQLPASIRSATLRKLDMLNAATCLRDLSSPPGNRLEALEGRLQGLFSIRVNQQWRLVFRWQDGEASAVRLLDYHD